MAGEAPGHEVRTALELDRLTRRFGDRVALDELTFSAPPGRMTGFLGPNGAGKTTAMRIVIGVSAADSGVVRWAGHPVTREDRLRFGYMPEERGLYPRMRVRDQIVYLARLHGLSAPAAAAATDRWLGVLGIGDRASDRLDALSHGNRQRAQLAAALVHDPELLVLDEPFSGLDPVGIDALGDVLRGEAARGATVLFSSHQLDVVEHLCEEVAIIDAGRVVTAGPIDAVRRRSGGPRLVVRVAGSPDAAWAAALPGVEVVRTDARGVHLLLGPDADPQRVLDAARAAGPVEHFAFEEPSLTEVFLSAVQRRPDEAAVAP